MTQRALIDAQKLSRQEQIVMSPRAFMGRILIRDSIGSGVQTTGFQGGRMYVLAILRYVKPLPEVLEHLEAHQKYLHALETRGWLIASGPFEPRTGGGLLLRLPDIEIRQLLKSISDDDPFTKAGVATYELLEWRPNRGMDRLDAIGRG